MENNGLYNELCKDLDKSSFNKAAQSGLLKYYKTQIAKNIKPKMGGFIAPESISLSVLDSKKSELGLEIKCSLFFEEQIGGCNCHDDPHVENGYDEIILHLNEQGVTYL
ncbi:MAG: hypothetical protein ISR69_02600 [Gammaproteobacteria bacterium]|nr:hypothetical protein [Gammaproteobacteria bacterium]